MIPLSWYVAIVKAWKCESFHIEIFFIVCNPGLSQGKDINVLIYYNIPAVFSFVPDRLDIQAPNSEP